MFYVSKAKVVFLPPYLPYFSPIEMMWSELKEFLRRSKPRTQAEFMMHYHMF